MATSPDNPAGPNTRPGADPADRRPILAVLCGELPPYRQHWHRRIAREIPEIQLRTLLFPIRVGSAWTVPDEPEFGLIRFDPKRPEGAAHVNVMRLTEYSDRSAKPVSFGTRLATIRAERREARVLFRWLRDHHPAAVLVNGHAPEPNMSTILWCYLNNVPTFIWADSNMHGDLAAGLKRLIKTLFLRALLGMVRVMLPCGSSGRTYFTRYVPLDKPMFFCPLEPDYDEITSTTPAEVEAMRARFNLDPARRRLIVVCRLIHLKRVDTLIDAFVRVASDRPDWDLLIVGDGSARAELEAMVPDALRHRVTWTGFISDQRIVNALYRNADVMVLPSEREAWALVVNEAAAAGLAMIVSNVVGAAPELVKEHVNGRTFPPGDSDALAECLLDVTQPATLARMRAASPQVLADFRRDFDPIQGLRKALKAVGVIR